jgi:lipid-A-disaccharide synthase-like uncharacterized protein
MSLRRPSLKSTLTMLLIASGIFAGIALIFRGAGAPVEPARAVMPGQANIEFPLPGRYIILAEQIIAPRPTEMSRLAAPPLDLVLTENLRGEIRGREIPVRESGWLDWAYKVLARGRGRTFGHVHVEQPGLYRLEGTYPKDAAESEKHGSVVLAFTRPASPGRLLWLLLGFGGQIIFSARFLIQWLASEKAGRSTIPRAFWYLSLAGGLMILAYASYTRDPVFIAGYAPTALIYVRNLVLLKREERNPVGAGQPAGRDG